MTIRESKSFVNYECHTPFAPGIHPREVSHRSGDERDERDPFLARPLKTCKNGGDICSIESTNHFPPNTPRASSSPLTATALIVCRANEKATLRALEALSTKRRNKVAEQQSTALRVARCALRASCASTVLAPLITFLITFRSQVLGRMKSGGGVLCIAAGQALISLTLLGIYEGYKAY